MAAALYFNADIMHYWSSAEGLNQIFELAILIVGGMLVYGLSIVAMGVIKPGDFMKYLKKGQV